MGLTLGARIGPYLIAEPIGAGGMGEVYRARDTRLGRDVAIKALPDQFSSDPDRLLRFEREAQLLASVSHPNLAAIHGMEEVDGSRYLALEYVEGETLAMRLAGGPLPVAEAIEVCLQIASGMEAAHEEGIVHRDLKPGNVMITPGDEVKVLDFGLAKGKVVEWEEVSPESPTVTMVASPVTMPGVILGTASYLSPEQARGKPVDRRTDIWSLGCLLYECLTGRKAFEGETVSDVIARILGGEVEWGRLPKETPVRLRELLERCLERDPRRRLRDMGDARLTLEEIREGRGGLRDKVIGRSRMFRTLAITGLSAVVLAAGAIAVWNWGRDGSPPRPVRRYEIQYPQSLRGLQRFDPVFLPGEHGVWVSPGGRFVFAAGFVGTEEHKGLGLLRRPIEGGDFEFVAGSNGPLTAQHTSDGRWLYFRTGTFSGGAASRQLMKIPADGIDSPVKVADWDSSWALGFVPLVSGELLAVAQPETAYVRIPAGGGTPTKPIPVDIPGLAGKCALVSALPGDRGVLVVKGRGIGVVDPETGKGKVLIEDGGCPRYAPTGHLLFSRRATLLAVPFDLDRLEVRGDPVPILDDLRAEWGGENGRFNVFQSGVLTYEPGGVIGNRRQLVVVDGEGRVTEWSAERRHIGERPAVDPSGDRVAFVSFNAEGTSEIWLSERGSAASQRIVGIPGEKPVWSHDGTRIAFLGGGGGVPEGVYIQSLEGGAARKVSEAKFGHHFIWEVSTWTPDGRALIVCYVTKREEHGYLARIAIPAEGESLSVPVPMEIPTNPLGLEAQFSPDRRWLSFWTMEGIFIARHHPDGSLGMPRKIVTISRYPRWSRDGKQIFYGGPHYGTRAWCVRSISLQFEPSLVASEPIERWVAKDLGLVTDAKGLSYFDILPGDRLLSVRGEGEEPVRHVEVVNNFFDEVKRKVRGAGKSAR